MAVTENVAGPKDLRLLRNVTNIDLAIVDMEKTGAEQVCIYLGRVRKIALALLVHERNTDWEGLISCPFVVYLPKDAEDSVLASAIKTVISHTSTLDDIYRTEKELTVKTLRLAVD